MVGWHNIFQTRRNQSYTAFASLFCRNRPSSGVVLVWCDRFSTGLSKVIWISVFNAGPVRSIWTQTGASLSEPVQLCICRVAQLRFPGSDLQQPVLLFFLRWSDFFFFFFRAGPHYSYRKRPSSVVLLLFFPPNLFQCCFIRADPLPFSLWKNGSGPNNTPPARCNYRKQDYSVLLPANCFWSSSSGRFRCASDLVVQCLLG